MIDNGFIGKWFVLLGVFLSLASWDAVAMEKREDPESIANVAGTKRKRENDNEKEKENHNDEQGKLKLARVQEIYFDFSRLPMELLLEILNYLDHDSLGECALVNHYMHGAVIETPRAICKATVCAKRAQVSPDSERLVTFSHPHDDEEQNQSRICILDAKTGKDILSPIEYEGFTQAMAFSPDSKTLALGCDQDEKGFLKVYDVQTGSIVFEHPHPNQINSIDFSHDGGKIATGCWDGRTRVFSAKTGQRLGKSGPNNDLTVSMVYFSPDAHSLITIYSNENSHSYDNYFLSGDIDIINDVNPRLLHGHNFQSKGHTEANGSFDEARCYFSPAGDKFVYFWWTTKEGQEVRVVNLLSGKKKGFNSNDESQHAINTAIFSRDGLKLITGDEGGLVKIWDAKNGKVIRYLEAHQNKVTSVAVSYDNRHVVSSSKDATIIWNLANGRRVLTLDSGSESAIFSCDGMRLFVLQDKKVKIYRIYGFTTPSSGVGDAPDNAH